MRAFASAALVLLLAPNVARGQTCPSNYFSTGGLGGFYEEYSTDPSHSAVGFSYDLVAGTLQGSHHGFGETGSFAQLTTQDRYVIVGPSSGTPIPVQVRVRFVGTAGADVVTLPTLPPGCLTSSVTLRLALGSLADEVTVQSASCVPRVFDETLELPIAKRPGEEFTLATTASIDAGHSIRADASGAIRFDGLPAGYSIQSCQGYAGSPVAVKSRSWGAVKQIYR